eukprot:jgi/Tetstr1/449603/TSEL_036690.t1
MLRPKWLTADLLADPLPRNATTVPLGVRMRVIRALESLVVIDADDMMAQLQRRGAAGCAGAALYARAAGGGKGAFLTYAFRSPASSDRPQTKMCWLKDPRLLPTLYGRHRAASAVQRWWRRGRFRRERARFVRADDLMLEAGDPGPLPHHLVWRVLRDALAARLRDRWGGPAGAGAGAGARSL